MHFFRRSSLHRGGATTNSLFCRLHGLPQFLSFLGSQDALGFGEHFILLFGHMLLDELAQFLEFRHPRVVILRRGFEYVEQGFDLGVCL